VAEAETEAPAAVLDASALLTHLNDEDGAPAVREAMKAGAAISVANWAEVLSKLAERGEDPGVAAAEMQGAELVGQAVSIEPITDDDCVEIARLRPATKSQGLSLADRACLVLAQRLGVPALTTDGEWAKAGTKAEVRLIR
jgi:PIN domain nuclease of toxin-antitoxin system